MKTTAKDNPINSLQNNLPLMGAKQLWGDIIGAYLTKYQYNKYIYIYYIYYIIVFIRIFAQNAPNS